MAQIARTPEILAGTLTEVKEMDTPPPEPTYGHVQEIKDSKYAEEQRRLRKREAEEREKALIAESRRRAAETSQGK